MLQLLRPEVDSNIEKHKEHISNNLNILMFELIYAALKSEFKRIYSLQHITCKKSVCRRKSASN